MKLTFALPFVTLTGGIRTLLAFANALHDEGHDVTVVHPTWPYPFHFGRRAQIDTFIREIHQRPGVQWMELRARLRRIPLISNAFMPDADLLIATSWPVIHDAAKLDASKGRKIHALFHHERGTGPERDVSATYRMPFHRIVFADSVRDQLMDEFACAIHRVASAGVDPRRFFPDGDRRPDSALMIYHPDPRKGSEDGIRALEAAKRCVPELEVTIAGTVRPPQLPGWMTFVFHPTDETLRRLYSTSTVFLYPSRYEGFGLPPLEAMACECPVVTTAVGAVHEYADATNARVVRPGDVVGMTEALVDVLRNDEQRRLMAAHGKETAARYAIDHMARRFVEALEAPVIN